MVEPVTRHLGPFVNSVFSKLSKELYRELVEIGSQTPKKSFNRDCFALCLE